MFLLYQKKFPRKRKLSDWNSTYELRKKQKQQEKSFQGYEAWRRKRIVFPSTISKTIWWMLRQCNEKVAWIWWLSKIVWWIQLSNYKEKIQFFFTKSYFSDDIFHLYSFKDNDEEESVEVESSREASAATPIGIHAKCVLEKQWHKNIFFFL